GDHDEVVVLPRFADRSDVPERSERGKTGAVVGRRAEFVFGIVQHGNAATPDDEDGRGVGFGEIASRANRAHPRLVQMADGLDYGSGSLVADMVVGQQG